ncbi:MAG: tyrosine-type recombinase/integrase, partial [Eubacterium sp.]|nr:tyrosine-type recombinase/integrase [Eubacterium sp.]
MAQQENSLITELKDYLISVRGYSKNTVDSYASDLIQFFRFLKLRFNQIDPDTPFAEIPITDVDSAVLKEASLPDIYAFMAYATAQRQNVDSTRKRRTAAIRSLYHYLTQVRGEKFEDPTAHLEVPKIKSRDPVYLTLDEAMSLLNAVEGRFYERDLAIITLFLNCGIRLSELTGLKMSDIQDESLHIVGKGNKERTIYLNDACVETLKAYLEVRPKDTEIKQVFI